MSDKVSYIKEVNITAFEDGVNYYTKDENGQYQAVVSGTAFDDSITYYIIEESSIVFLENVYLENKDGTLEKIKVAANVTAYPVWESTEE